MQLRSRRCYCTGEVREVMLCRSGEEGPVVQVRSGWSRCGGIVMNVLLYR